MNHLTPAQAWEHKIPPFLEWHGLPNEFANASYMDLVAEEMEVALPDIFEQTRQDLHSRLRNDAAGCHARKQLAENAAVEIENRFITLAILIAIAQEERQGAAG